MGTALQHNVQLAIKLALPSFIKFPHYEVSIEHCVYCAYYEGKEPSSSGGVPSANGILTKQNTRHQKQQPETHQMTASII